VPEHLLAETGVFPEGTYVGTGPFRYAGSKDERKIVLQRNPDHFAGPPSYNWLIFKTIEDENTRLLALLGGSADLLQNAVSPILLEVLAERPELKVQTAESISFTYLGLNLRIPALADVRVRQALALGIDREAIVKHRFVGHATLATGMLAPFHWAYEKDVARWGFDPERAEALLDEAGYPRDPQTGTRLAIELKLSNNRFRRSVAELIVRHLGRIGVDVTLRSYEFGTFLADVRKGNFDMFLLQLPEPVEPDMLRWMLHSMNTPDKAPPGARTEYEAADRRFYPPKAETLAGDPVCGAWTREVRERGERAAAGQGTLDLGSANRTFYFNPRFDCLVDLGQTTVDREARKRLYGEAQRIVAQELPVIPLWHEDNVAVMRKKIEGYEILPSGRLAPLSRTRVVKR
jgi:peptide/nickel transport system substrate-binding protein